MLLIIKMNYIDFSRKFWCIQQQEHSAQTNRQGTSTLHIIQTLFTYLIIFSILHTDSGKSKAWEWSTGSAIYLRPLE